MYYSKVQTALKMTKDDEEQAESFKKVSKFQLFFLSFETFLQELEEKYRKMDEIKKKEQDVKEKILLYKKELHEVFIVFLNQLNSHVISFLKR